MSSQVGSCTKPIWLASMKQGSHIMLQRLVRSTVSTAPRPYRMVLDPWLWTSLSLWAGMSLPGKFRSIHSKNFESMDMMSSKWPWTGQSLSIQTWPSRSTMFALTSPTFSLRRDFQSFSPWMIFWRASLTHSGQSESVWRGHPSGGLLFCQDFKSGLSDHRGVKDGFGWNLLKN